MTTVSIHDKYVEVLTVFGDLQQAVELALQRYTIEQVTAKITELRQKNARYQAKYGMDYPAFAERIATDEAFVKQVETSLDKTWEFDLADWEFSYKGIEDWMQKLQAILLT